MSAAEKKEREESNHPVFIVKLRNSELIKDSVASFMIHARGNPAPEMKIFKVVIHYLKSSFPQIENSGSILLPSIIFN